MLVTVLVLVLLVLLLTTKRSVSAVIVVVINFCCQLMVEIALRSRVHCTGQSVVLDTPTEDGVVTFANAANNVNMYLLHLDLSFWLTGLWEDGRR